MPTRSRLFRPDFDRSRDFVVAKYFPYNGKDQVIGQAFDKTLCTVRRLRQLYDSRRIEMVELVNGYPLGRTVPPLPPPPPEAKNVLERPSRPVSRRRGPPPPPPRRVERRRVSL